MVPKQAVLKVQGMVCDNCARSVREALEEIEGVFSAAVTLEQGEVLVTYDASAIPGHALLSAVEGAGYKAEFEGNPHEAHDG